MINQIVTGPNHAALACLLACLLDAREVFDIASSPLHSSGMHPGDALIRDQPKGAKFRFRPKF